MANNSTTLIHEDELESVSIGPYILAVFSIIWTIAANTVILICFYRDRRKVWTIFMALTCSMSATDLMMANNSTSLIHEDELEHVSIGPYILAVFSIIWTIAANTVILICFYRDRRKICTIFVALTCSMSATDLMMTNNTSSLIHEDELESVSIGPYILAVFSIIWTIAANTVILICFYRDRRKIWTIFMALTCSMSATDLMVGLTGIPVLISGRENVPLHDFGCFLTFLLLQCTQLSSLVHVLGVCIYRSIKINSKKTVSDTLNNGRNKTVVVLIILASWLLPPLIFTIPYILWSDVKGHLIRCTITDIFGSDVEKLQKVGLMLSIVYGVTQLATDALYVTTLLRLRWRANRVVVPNSIELQAPVQGTSQSRMPETIRRTTSQATIDVEKRTNRTVGILLLLFNVFTFPVTFAYFLSQGEIQVNRNARYIVSTFFIINSGLNSIVYAVRIPSIRESLTNLFRDIKRFLHLD